MSVSEEWNGNGVAHPRAEVLVALAAGLDSLNTEVEVEFLAIGQKLIDCIATINLMSSGLNELASLIAGDHGVRASQALNGALGLAADMTVRAEESKVNLGAMRQDAVCLARALAQFGKTVSAFHTLGRLTRIETRRLRDSGLDLSGLASDVRFLALNVRSKVEDALFTVEELTPLIESALQEVETLQEGRVRELHLLASEVSSGLAEFRVMQDKAHEASVRLGGEYREVSNSCKKLVICLQFHDITRQRLEHVIAALRRVSAYYQETKAGTPHESPVAVAALELQSLQIADAAEKFESAVASVLTTLDDIVLHVRQMVTEGRALANLSSDDENPFFLKLERDCGLILTSLEKCATAEGAAAVTTHDLIEMIASMRASIEDIRVIETQMQRTGANARMGAGQFDAAGDNLRTLGRSIEQKAIESRNDSDSLVKMLNALNEAANQSYVQSQPPVAIEHVSLQDCLDQMRAVVHDLRSRHETSCRQMADVSARGDSLVQDITLTRAKFSIGSQFAEAVNRTQDTLKGLVQEARSGSLSPNTEPVGFGLAEFVGKYTMQGEVDVYEALMKALGETVPVTAPEALSHATAGEEEEDAFGDNVELF